MCHAFVPEGQRTAAAPEEEIEVPLPGGERMPALHGGTRADAPAVLISSDVYGRSQFYEHLAALLVEEGFEVLLPDYFFREGPLAEVTKEAAFARRAKLDEGRSVEDLRAAVKWLRGEVPGKRTGVVGFCMGGTFALDLASTQPDLVTVSYYGFPLPQANLVMPPPRPMDLVRSLEGPVLAFWGDKDETVGLENVKDYIAAARAANSQFEYDVLPGLGHGFLAAADLGDREDAGGGASWARTVEFLHRHLGQ